MTSGTQIADAPKVEEYEFVFPPLKRRTLFLSRTAVPLLGLPFCLFVLWPDTTMNPQLLAAKIFLVTQCVLGGIMIVRQALSFWSRDESFRCTCRVTRKGIVKEYPSGRIEAGKASELTAIEGGGRTVERWWHAFINPPVVLHFENGEKLTLVPRIPIAHWAAYYDYHLLLEKLGRLWQGNPIIDEWSLRHRQQKYSRYYVFINLSGIAMSVFFVLFAADPRATRLSLTLPILVGVWIAALIYAFFWIRKDQHKTNLA